jgi:hypothetical protein
MCVRRRGLRKLVHVAACLSLFHLVACSVWSRPPKKWLPHAEESQRDAYGGWVRVEGRDGDVNVSYRGELIAVHPDSLYVLEGGGLRVIATEDVDRAEVVGYDSGFRDAAGLATAGALFSLLSHGFFLVFSVPVWTGVGRGEFHGLLNKARLRTPKKSPEGGHSKPPLAWGEALGEFAKYARFPQGLPPDLDLNGLTPRDAWSGPEPRDPREQPWRTKTAPD